MDTKKEIFIDAKGKKLGRVASEAAFALRGKTSADFLPHRISFPKVFIKNVDGLNLSEQKLKKTFFVRYSGYPGGQKIKSASNIAEVSKTALLKKAILGMIRRNKLKSKMIKNLTLYHGDQK
ncbi:MAG: 50S ribosomal protein L13 [Patescibacteria group bacterium]